MLHSFTTSSLFNLIQFELIGNEIHATLLINPESVILKAHFPGDPIIPGVCQLLLIKNLIHLGFPRKKFFLQNADNIKFVDIIRPNSTQTLQVIIQGSSSENNYSVKSSIFYNDRIFLKATLNYAVYE